MQTHFHQLFFWAMLGLLVSCAAEVPEPAPEDAPSEVTVLEVTEDTLVNLTELEPCDILVKPNTNLLPGSSWVMGGRGFGHALLVIEGAQDSNTMSLLRKVKIFESQARIVPEAYELRTAPGFREGDDYRFANTTFGLQNKGYRFLLRLNLTQAQKDSVIRFVLAQDDGVSSWRAQKISTAGGGARQVQDRKVWYCSLLVWQAFYNVLGIDLDPNGGIMVYPNDLICSPYFDKGNDHQLKRVRF